MDSDSLPLEEIRIKEEPEYFDSSIDWNENNPCDTLIKVELLETDSNSKNLVCKECNSVFVSEHELNIHRMIHSSDHTCFICKEFVRNRFQFVGHVRKHMCAKPFKCPSCDRSFPSPRETKLHQRVHSDDRPFMCTECGKAFKQISTLKDHEVVHTGEKKFKCKICEGAFATATSLRRHIHVMHETVRSYPCRYCRESFTSQQAREQHTAIHKDIDPLKCTTCGEKLADLEEFTLHRNKHLDVKASGTCEYCGNKTFYFGLKEHIEKTHQPRSCEICSLIFYDEKSMENHQKSHLEEAIKEGYACQECGKIFEFPRYLKAHMKRHEQDYKKYKCDLCSKFFCSKRDLQNHLNVHANIKNFACEICNKPFRTKESVRKHMPIHSEKRPFECPLCDKRFKKQSILRKHSFTHSKVRQFACDLCEKTYKTKESLRVHKIAHHQRRKKKCKICKKTFHFESIYKQHDCVTRYRFDICKRRCNVCKRFCRTIITYVHHLRGHLRERLFQCNICKEPLRNQYQVKLHTISHRNEKKV
ncbi:zinc finger protein 711-like [Diabrotica undecimpunctata]|uniref:zinc finger protein 711-like n=1 Tax=Diabrotica undecimpunctata TaxID=50387 RepID=UPI003B642295